MPSFQDDAQDTRKFGGIKAVALCDRDFGLQPDFGVLVAALDVNVLRLARKSFVGEEKVTQATSRKTIGMFRPEPIGNTYPASEPMPTRARKQQVA